MYSFTCTYICFLFYISHSWTLFVEHSHLLRVWTKCFHALMHWTRKMINAVDEHQCTIISSYSHSHRRCRCVAISLPAVKLAAVKYGVLTSGLRYTGLSAREMGDPGRGCDDLVTLSRTGDLASVHRVTLVLSADILCVAVGVPTFLQPISQVWALGSSLIPTFPTLDTRDGVSICVTSRNFRAVEQLHKSFVRLSRSHGE